MRGHLQWPPKGVTLKCCGSDHRWEEVPSEGPVHTYTVGYRAFNAWLQGRLPYGIVVVDLAPGSV